MDFNRLLPVYWLQNASTDLRVDAIINAMLDKYGIEKVTHNVYAKVGPITIWVSNWPYAYGTIENPRKVKGLPTVKTRKRIKRLVDQMCNSDLGAIRKAIDEYK